MKNGLVCLVILSTARTANAQNNDWASVGSSPAYAVFALAVSGNTLYAGGSFTTPDAPASYVAQWDGTNWSPLGLGVNATVWTLASWGNALYVGGNFSTAGGYAANGTAKWDGTNWSPVGAGKADTFAIFNNTLYAGGSFGFTGGVSEWNGSAWIAVSSGNPTNYTPTPGPLDAALALFNGTLYAAGYTQVCDIGEWNGSSWSPAGFGINGDVSALTVFSNTLYATGSFSTAEDGSIANYMAQWNGSLWVPVTSSIASGPIYATFVSGNTMYVSTYIDYSYAVAAWNGTTWTTIGTGLNGDVYALAISGNTLYAGGSFQLGASPFRGGVAELTLPTPTPTATILTTNAAFGINNGVFGFDVSGTAGANVIIQSSTDLQSWTPLQSTVLGTGAFYFSDSQPPTNQERFYRIVASP